MQKAVGRVNALVVAVSILVIAFRAGTQPSPYSSGGTEAGSSQGQGSSQTNSPSSLPNQDRRVRILAVTPAPVWERRVMPPQLPAVDGTPDKSTASSRDFGPTIRGRPLLRSFFSRANPTAAKQAAAPLDAKVLMAKPSPAPATSSAPVEGDGRPNRAAAVKIVSLRSSPSAAPVVARPPEPARVVACPLDRTTQRQSQKIAPHAYPPPHVGGGQGGGADQSHHPSPFTIHLSKASRPAAETKSGFLFPDAVSPYHPVPMTTSAKPSATPKPLRDEIVNRAIENPTDKRQAFPLGEQRPAKNDIDLPPQPVPVKPEETAPKPAAGPDSPPKTSPPLDNTTPESGGPEGFLDLPSPSLVQAGYQSQHQKAIGGPSNLPAVEPRFPRPLPVATPPGDGQNSAEPSAEEPVVTIINHDPERENSQSPPRVITPDARYSPPDVLSGQSSEIAVPRSQKPPVRRFILMPQAIDDLPSDPVAPKEAPVLPERPSPLEHETPAESTSDKIGPLLQALPTTVNQGPSAIGLGKIPLSSSDPALVLGPATELLESKRTGITPDRSPASEVRPVDTTPAMADAEKALSSNDLSDIDKLRTYIQTACGDAATGLSVALDASNQLQVRLKVKNDADGERIGRRILDLPRLAPYQVSLDIEVVP